MITNQPRNKFTFLVTWPEGTAPTDCPQSYRVWYRTLAIADTVARGFELAGAEVTR